MAGTGILDIKLHTIINHASRRHGDSAAELTNFYRVYSEFSGEFKGADTKGLNSFSFNSRKSLQMVSADSGILIY